MRHSLKALAVVFLTGVGCASDSSGSGGDDPELRSITGVVGSGGTLASIQSGRMPDGSSGPQTSLPEQLSIINGGSAVVSLSANAPLSAILVGVEGESGYFRLPVSGSSTASQFTVTASQDLTGDNIRIQVGALGVRGEPGPITRLLAPITRVGTGDVQVSLAWDAFSDVDLHVIDPLGEEIYFGNRSSESGGVLDLDSNAGCGLDRVNNENVTWPAGRSPAGEYRVLVNYWSNCSVEQTNWALTVTVRGNPPLVYQGVLLGSGNRGGRGAGTLVTRFSTTGGSQSIRAAWPTEPGDAATGRDVYCADWADHPTGCFGLNGTTRLDKQPFQRHYNEEVQGYHLGADWNRDGGCSDRNDIVYATMSGRVFIGNATTEASSWGNVVFIRHQVGTDVFTSMYAHVNWLPSGPPSGDVVRGQPIALVGDANGYYAGQCHLHFEMRRGDNRTLGTGYTTQRVAEGPQGQVDPNQFIQSWR